MAGGTVVTWAGGDLGAPTPGYAADLVPLDAHPGQDAQNLSAIWRVAKGGQVIDRDALVLFPASAQ